MTPATSPAQRRALRAAQPELPVQRQPARLCLAVPRREVRRGEPHRRQRPSAGADSLLVGPERANDAELGIKSTLFDRRLQLNANLFWTGINGYQATTYYQPPAPDRLAGTGQRRLRSRGLEFEATALPLRGLTLNFNGSYNDVTYLSFKDAPCPAEISTQAGAPATCDLSGKRVIGASKWIANLNGEYKWQLEDRLEPYVTASYAYRSEAEGTLDDSACRRSPATAGQLLRGPAPRPRRRPAGRLPVAEERLRQGLLPGGDHCLQRPLRRAPPASPAWPASPCATTSEANMSQAQIKLGAFLMGSGHHLPPGAIPAPTPAPWTSSTSAPGQTAERGKFDSIFFADNLALLGSPELASRTIGGEVLDPLMLFRAGHRHRTHRPDLHGVHQLQRSIPAARFASLDHLSGGRAGWNLVTSATDRSPQLRPRTALRARRALRPRRGVHRCRPRPVGQLRGRRLSPRQGQRAYFDPRKLHTLDHQGSITACAAR
jgi:hypothetical protein